MDSKTDKNKKIDKIKDNRNKYMSSPLPHGKRTFKRVLNLGMRALVIATALTTLTVTLKRDSERKINQESYVPSAKWEKYRKYEDKIVAGIAVVEKFSNEPYLCGGGYWTIAYGNREVNGEPVNADTYYVSKTFNNDFVTKYDTTQSVHENFEDAMFLRGKEYVVDHLDKNFYPVIDEYVKVPLNEYEMTAVAMFMYNIGSQSFINSEFLKALNSGEKGLALAKKMTGFRAISKKNIFGETEKTLSKGLLKREWLMMNIFLNTPVISKDSNGKKMTTYFASYLPQMIPGRFYKERDMNFYFHEEIGTVGENGYYTPKTDNITMLKFIEKNTHPSKNVGSILDKKTRESINKNTITDTLFIFQKSKTH